MTPITPYRDTRLEIDVTERTLARAQYDFRRSAARLSRQSTAEAGPSEGVMSAAGQVWFLRPILGEAPRIVATPFSASVVQGADVNLAGSVVGYSTWRAPTDLPGVTVDPTVIPSGNPAYIRRVVAGQSFNQTLAADEAAFPGPTLDSEYVPMDRVMQGRVTYPSNTGFSLGFYAANYINGVDNLLTFYFGGPTETWSPNDPRAVNAGIFALNLRGSGIANLYEGSNDGSSPTWVRRLQFEWSEPTLVADRLHTISIIPLDKDKILFLLGGSSVSIGPMPYFGQTFSRGPSNPQQCLYIHDPGTAGYAKQANVTGPGIFRVDMRRDLRFPLMIKRNLYPTAGTLVDGAFLPPYALPDGTPMRILPQMRLPFNTDLVVTAFDAKTGTSLAQDGDGNWLSLAGVRPYYVTFDLLSADRLQTPLLYGFSVRVAKTLTVREPITVYGRLRDVSISGPGTSPDMETAHGTISNDLLNECNILRRRARIPIKITTTRSDDPDDARVVLFRGEVATAPATKKGKTGRQGLGGAGEPKTFPVPQWHQYDVDMVGEWSRLSDQINVSIAFYAEDDDADIDPVTGTVPPWKVTDVIKDLLGRCGVADEAMDIPDNDLRLWPSTAGGDVDIYVLQPGVNSAELIQRLCQGYLGQFLIFDANAGEHGMWRLLDNPSAPYTSRYLFKTIAPDAGTLPQVGCFGPNSAPVQTTETWVEPPEANRIIVMGASGDGLSNDNGKTLAPAVLANYTSYDPDPLNPTADPTSEDYLGREVPLVWVDLSLTEQSAVNWIARRLYDLVAHGRKWRRWHAPLVFIEDPDDQYLVDGTGARMLRLNDVVTFNADTYLLRSCSPTYHSDQAQMADYEGVLLASGV